MKECPRHIEVGSVGMLVYFRAFVKEAAQLLSVSRVSLGCSLPLHPSLQCCKTLLYVVSLGKPSVRPSNH